MTATPHPSATPVQVDPPAMTAEQANTAREYIASRIVSDASSGCWIWQGWKSKRGYGRCRIFGSAWTVSRLSFVAHGGVLLRHEFACHRCDNPPCCNPAHLFSGTSSDNAADKVAKQRQVKGTSVNTAKLNEEKTARMRAEYMAGANFCAIARDHGVSDSQARRACLGLSWKHVVAPTVASRPNRGSFSGSAKLCEADVVAIRLSPDNSTVLSKAYNVSFSLICMIRRRVAWKHVL